MPDYKNVSGVIASHVARKLMNVGSGNIIAEAKQRRISTVTESTDMSVLKNNGMPFTAKVKDADADGK